MTGAKRRGLLVECFDDANGHQEGMGDFFDCALRGVFYRPRFWLAIRAFC
jgi:hypothetical protein